jgi:hypothetical protein
MMRMLFAHRQGQMVRNTHMSNMVDRLFYTKLGQIFISILFGVSLSLMFHRVCKGDQCITLDPPPTKHIEGKIFRVKDACYEYDPEVTPCKAADRAS